MSKPTQASPGNTQLMHIAHVLSRPEVAYWEMIRGESINASWAAQLGKAPTYRLLGVTAELAKRNGNGVQRAQLIVGDSDSASSIRAEAGFNQYSLSPPTADPHAALIIHSFQHYLEVHAPDHLADCSQGVSRLLGIRLAHYEFLLHVKDEF